MAGAPTPALASVRDGLPAALGNRPLLRLTAVGRAGFLAAHPSIAASAGNHAVQRLIDPVQRETGDDDAQPAATTPVTSAIATAGATTPGDVTPGLTRANTPVNPATSIAVATDSTFRNATTATDVAGGLMAANTAANMGMKAARFAGEYTGALPNEVIDTSGYLIPGVGEALSLMNIGENATRASAATARGQAMTQGAEGMRRADGLDVAAGQTATRGRAAEIFERGALEQKDESDARATSATLSGVQAALLGTGIALDPTGVGGTGALASAGVIGGMKGALGAARFARKKWTQSYAASHAQQVLFAAHAGDPDAISTLQAMNIPTEGLDDPATWQSAVQGLSEAMPRDAAGYADGTGIPGASVAIDDRRPPRSDDPRYRGFGSDDPQQTPIPTTGVNPLVHDLNATDDDVADPVLDASTMTASALSVRAPSPHKSGTLNAPPPAFGVSDQDDRAHDVYIDDVDEDDHEPQQQQPAAALTANGFTGAGDWFM